MKRFKLTVLATSDLHLHLCAWDDFADRPAPYRGMAHVAAEIAYQRKAADNVLLLDNGDFLQGTPLGECLAQMHVPSRETPHPMIAAMNLLGYDAVGLGNHEFNHGLGFLTASLAAARFPVLCANLMHPGGARPIFTPHVLLDRPLLAADGTSVPCRIGVMSVLPPQVTVWDHEHLSSRAVAKGIVDTARATVTRMKTEGAAIIIALCHSGIGTATGGLRPEAEDAALALAGLDGIDAVVAGHSHQVFPGPGLVPGVGIDAVGGRLAGKPAAMPGAFGSHLARLRLDLQQMPDGSWTSLGGDGTVIDLQRPPRGQLSASLEEGLAAVCQTSRAMTARYLARPAGRITAPISTHFAAIGACTVSRLIGQAMRWHVERELDAGPLASLPVLAAAAPFRCGGRGGATNYTDLSAGQLTERHLTAMFPFPNSIRAIQITGAGLADWLEHAAGAFRQISADGDALMSPDFPAYNLDQIEGLTYSIDPTQPPRFLPTGGLADPGARRIRALRFRGQPIAPDAPFILATNSYRIAGGGYFPGCGAQARIVLSTHTPVRTIVGAFLALTGPWQPPGDPVWRLQVGKVRRVRFETGPGAMAYPWPDGVEYDGIGPDGFLRMQLRF